MIRPLGGTICLPLSHHLARGHTTRKGGLDCADVVVGMRRKMSDAIQTLLQGGSDILSRQVTLEWTLRISRRRSTCSVGGLRSFRSDLGGLGTCANAAPSSFPALANVLHLAISYWLRATTHVIRCAIRSTSYPIHLCAVSIALWSQPSLTPLDSARSPLCPPGPLTWLDAFVSLTS